MRKKQAKSKLHVNPLRTYVSDDELDKFTERMVEEGYASVSGYLRRLIMKDIRQ